jgi:dihydroorotate dehydrogenase (NAD+) catalytic subunit
VKRKRLVVTTGTRGRPGPATPGVLPSPATGRGEVRTRATPVPAGPRDPVTFTGDSVDLHVELAPARPGRLRLAHPLLVAAGGAGYGVELMGASGASPPAAIITRGLSARAQPNPPAPQMALLGGSVPEGIGLLTSLAPQGPTLETVLERHAGAWAAWEVPVVVNLWADSAAGFGSLARALDGQPGVAGVELDLSCSDRHAGGSAFGWSAGAAASAVRAARAETDLPLIAKLPPNAPDVRSIALAVTDAGADAISATGRLPALAVDRRRRRALPAAGGGGLSGAALKPVALRCVNEIAQVTSVSIIGVGGVACLEDVLDYLLAGASAVGMATAVLADPGLPGRLAGSLRDWCAAQGLASPRDIVGAALPRRTRRRGGSGLRQRP